jgi:hypothetical protein
MDTIVAIVSMVQNSTNKTAWELIRTNITNIKEITIALAAILTAVFGYNAWKKQLRAKIKYEHEAKLHEEKRELSKKVLRKAYDIKKAMQYLRNPFIDINEMNESRTKVIKDLKEKGEVFEEKDIDNIKAVYHVRQKEISELSSNLEETTQEVLVIIGKEGVETINKLVSCIRELNYNLTIFLEFKKDHSEYDREEWKHIKSVIYWSSDDPEQDKFTSKIDSSIKAIEEYFQTYLKPYEIMS